MRRTRVVPFAVSRAATRSRGQSRRTALSVLLACGVALATTVTSQAQQPRQKNSTQKAQKSTGKKNSEQKAKNGANAARKEGDRRPGGRNTATSRRTTTGRKSSSAAERKRRTAQRDRWSSLSAQKRKQLEAIYRQLRELPPDKRKLLLDRLRDLDSNTRRERIRSAKKRLENDASWFERQSRQTRRAVLESLPQNVRDRLQRLPAKERQKHLQQLVANRRAKLIERLPPGVAAEVRALPPGKQTQRIKQSRTSQVFRRTFQDREEINRLRKLPQKELRRLLAVKGAGDSAAPKPDYLSTRTWERWKALKRYERDRILRLVRTGGDLRSGRPSQGRPSQERARPERGRTRAKPDQTGPKAGPRNAGPRNARPKDAGRRG